MEKSLETLFEHILSECGIVSTLLFVFVVYLAVQLAKTRGAWESDRAGMMKIIAAHQSSWENLAGSHSKLEGMLLQYTTSRRAGE